MADQKEGKRRVGIALIGVGYWGKNYLRAIKEMVDDFNLYFVVDTNPESLAFHQKRHQAVDGGASPHSLSFTGDLNQVLADDRVEVVVIATPAFTHFDLGMKCLNANKHILVEKPLATNSTDAAKMVQLAKQKGKQILVGFTVLFVPSVMKAKTIIDSDEFGTPYYFYSSRTNLGIVRTDVNVNWELAPHDIAVFQHWLNSRPMWCSAVGCKFLGPREDTIFVTIQYENGVTGNMMFSWADPKKSRENVLVSSNMRISVDDVDVMGPLRIHRKAIDKVPVSVSSRQNDAAGYGEFRLITKDGDLLIPSLTFSEPLKNKLGHLAQAVRDPRMTPINNGNLGLLVCRVCEAIDRSMEQNGAPVQIDTSGCDL